MSLHLNKLKTFSGRKGPLLLIIMDGIGLGKADETNAVFRADTPNLDELFKSKLYTQLKAHGKARLSTENMFHTVVDLGAIREGSYVEVRNGRAYLR